METNLFRSQFLYTIHWIMNQYTWWLKYWSTVWYNVSKRVQIIFSNTCKWGHTSSHWLLKDCLQLTMVPRCASGLITTWCTSLWCKISYYHSYLFMLVFPLAFMRSIVKEVPHVYNLNLSWWFALCCFLNIKEL
jgi:hypothetical protein